MSLNLLKLCVGAESLEDLATWQAGRPDRWGTAHVTRMRPRRAEEVLAGGSLYWVIKGSITCRQRIIALEEVIGDDGIPRCAIVMDRRIIRTRPAPRRPFQGWRYLTTEDAPADENASEGDEPLPEELRRALADIGVF